jgi:hypothetical protein
MLKQLYHSYRFAEQTSSYLRKTKSFAIVKADISSINNSIEWSMAMEPFLQRPGSQLGTESMDYII